MTYMIIRHKVRDYDAWKPGYDGHLPAREAAGLREVHLMRNVDDPQEVIAMFEVSDLEKARAVVLNAKTRRTGICGAMECLLIDRAFYDKHGAVLVEDLVKAGVEVRTEGDLLNVVGTVAAAPDDFGREFLDMICAAKIVDGVDGAIAHIRQYGSNHTESILTEDDAAAARFFQRLDSAILMRNASTQFADGGEFGMGAEIGIATGKLHARGPVGAEQLTSFKYLVVGDGTCRK